MTLPKLLSIAALALTLSACVSMPAPRYQPGVENTSVLLQHRPRLSIGAFTASTDINNRSLSIRGSQLKGGSDGTYSGYLREALISELEAAHALDASAPVVLSGELTRNSLDGSGVKVGKAEVGARFAVARNGTEIYARELIVQHEWESSFVGAIAIPAAMDNYSAAVQKLIGKLLADPEFIAAVQSD
ncbi:hypothetical protein [Pseudoxanthomonas mexicana]|uniref:hypothetical protein n=1 Tax=Pseudoxanthomonas mexicana TaxID=128785 RepID=UPI00398A62A9